MPVLGPSLFLNRTRRGGAGGALVRARVRAARGGNVFHATKTVVARGQALLYLGAAETQSSKIQERIFVFFACMLPVGIKKNKNSRGRKKNGLHGHYFGG